LNTAADAVLGSAAIPVGATIWGVSKGIQELCDDEDIKKIFKFSADCGRVMFTGGVINVVIREIRNKEMGKPPNSAVKTTDKVIDKIAGNFVAGLGRKLEGSSEELIYTIHDSGFIPDDDIRKHLDHLERGVTYQHGCK
ncbi:7195_t:CDS:2, partial [Racocetra fulgida]